MCQPPAKRAACRRSFDKRGPTYQKVPRPNLDCCHGMPVVPLEVTLPLPWRTFSETQRLRPMEKEMRPALGYRAALHHSVIPWIPYILEAQESLISSKKTNHHTGTRISPRHPRPMSRI